MNTNEIKLSFSVLNDVLDEAINNVNIKGSKEFANGNHSYADNLLKRANEIKQLKEKLLQLENSLEKILDDSLISKIVKDEAIDEISKRIKERLNHGLKTPQRKYRIPILKALMFYDGRAKTAKVLNYVNDLMRNQFNSYDLEIFRVNEPRWKNTTMWERKNMVLDGLISDQSPRGIWEITQNGKDYYNSMHAYLKI